MELEKSVIKYYDNNTKRFMKYGQGGETESIHRAVFSHKSTKQKEAFRYHENKVLEYIKKEEASLIVDLGCGTGGSISYLFSKYKAKYHGITISSIQANMANYLAKDPNISISLGSYLDLSSYEKIQSIKGRRIFFAIESYLHCPDRNKFFSILKMQSSPGDILIIADDFRSSRTLGNYKTDRDIKDFTTGWHAAELQGLENIQEMANSYCFTLIENIELTKWLKIDRPRDMLISILVPLLRIFKMKNSWWQNLLGGNALRRGLKKGWLTYRFLVWKRISK